MKLLSVCRNQVKRTTSIICMKHCRWKHIAKLLIGASNTYLLTYSLIELIVCGPGPSSLWGSWSECTLRHRLESRLAATHNRHRTRFPYEERDLPKFSGSWAISTDCSQIKQADINTQSLASTIDSYKAQSLGFRNRDLLKTSNKTNFKTDRDMKRFHETGERKKSD